MTNALRLAVGTLTILRVPAPTRVDGRVGRDAILLAPLVGLALGILAEAVALVVRVSIPGYVDRLFVAVAAVAALAVVTRGLHLDGLADTADGLGSNKSPAVDLAVMSRSDVGAFGVVTVVLMLLLQISALYTALYIGRGTLALVGGAVVSRLAIGWACRRGIPSAKPDGLGSVVADRVPMLALVVATVAVASFLAAVVWLDDDVRFRFAVQALLALGAALALSHLFVRHCVKRFDGVTGDVLGAVNEIAFLIFVMGIAVW